MPENSNDAPDSLLRDDGSAQTSNRPVEPDPDFPPGEIEPVKPHSPFKPEPFDPDFPKPHVVGPPHVPSID